MLKFLLRILFFYLIFRFLSNLIRLAVFYFNKRPKANKARPRSQPQAKPFVSENIVDAEFTDI